MPFIGNWKKIGLLHFLAQLYNSAIICGCLSVNQNRGTKQVTKNSTEQEVCAKHSHLFFETISALLGTSINILDTYQ